MLIESAIGNIEESAPAPEAEMIDWLDLTWVECHCRFARKTSRGGQDLRLLLRIGRVLKHGDILGTTAANKTIVVNLLPAHVLVISFRDPSQAIAAAFQIGNLHLPIEVLPDSLVLPARAESEAMLVKLDIPFQPAFRRFVPTHWPDAVRLSPEFHISLIS